MEIPRLRRPVLRSVPALALAAVLAVILGAAPAAAAPQQPPPTREDAAAQLEVVQHEAEALTEEWHAARDALDLRQQELDAANAAIGPAMDAAATAIADEERFRVESDALVTSTFESGNLDQFNALLAAGSPQDFLDQMSALELLASDQRTILDQLAGAVEDAAATQAAADAAVLTAQQATDAAAAAEAEIDARRTAADERVDEAEELLDSLTPQQRADRSGSSGSTEGPALPGGSGVGSEAVRAAAVHIGKPYRFGGNGPENFDCSGLTSWAFREAGVTIPRSSSQQATIGTRVGIDELQPGDLVFYYDPISHVSIYAGDGMVITAPQTGDVVKYQALRPNVFTTARRI